MSWRVGCGILAFVLLSACADTGPNSDFSFASVDPAPQPQPVITRDPAFRYSELKGGIPLARLQGMYGPRLAYVSGDNESQQYVVEPSTAVPGTTGQRDRLMLWLIDGHLATWAVEATGEPVILAAAPAPTALPTAPQRAHAALDRGNFAVQIAARRSDPEARAAINELRAKHTALLGQRGVIVYRVSLPQGVFYRAMIGPFPSSIQANEMCGQLRAAGADCFVRGV
jgi:SPOR domain